jgi:hypothetical protein
MVNIEQICDPEWAEWYCMSPKERWRETEKLWNIFLTLGGSLDPEPDTQSPFNNAFTAGPLSSHGRTGLRIVRRSGI